MKCCVDYQPFVGFDHIYRLDMARQTGSDKAQIKQKAGGSGKKGKQFMEDKVGCTAVQQKIDCRAIEPSDAKLHF